MIEQKEIGNRIAIIRKKKGYSQDELAKLLGISRPSLTQIERGNRNLSVIELKSILDIFSISMDYFLSTDFDINQYFTENKPENIVNEAEVRISVPSLNIQKFKQVLLYILEKCAGKPNVGETVLYKLLYFSDFNYYEIYEEHLSGAEYKKLPYGPVPQRMDGIIEQMLTEGSLQRINTEYHGYPQKRYLPLSKPDLSVLKASEKDVIDKVIDQYSDWSATAISDYSHKDMPWLVSKEGEIINYELAFYREAPYSVRNYNEEA